jgi:hypothetical protein
MKPPTMTATFIPLQLLQFLTTIPDKPIRLFWDRATWHRGAPIRQVLVDNPRLEIITFLVTSLEFIPQEPVDKFECHLTSTIHESSLLNRHAYTNIYPIFTRYLY